MRNIRLTLTYDGTDFHGWQRQLSLPTIQETLETVIERVTGAKARVWGSGRTDAGVHALNQVANFKTDCPIPCPNLVKALNDVLPPTIRVKAAEEVQESFHARRHARSKTYRYRILLAPVCSPFLWRFVCHYPYPLNRAAVAEAAPLFEGTHDFTSFAASEEDDAASVETDEVRPTEGASTTKRGMVRTIFTSRLIWRPKTSMLIYGVRGNGFLHHMVRNMVGTLLEVGRGKLAPADILKILKAKDRTLAGPTAPAQGLCLVRVEY